MTTYLWNDNEEARDIIDVAMSAAERVGSLRAIHASALHPCHKDGIVSVDGVKIAPDHRLPLSMYLVFTEDE